MEPLVHLIIPTVILLAFRPVGERKKILLLSPFAVLMDLDFLIGHAIFHNIFAVALITVLVYLASSKSKFITFVCAFYLISHLILDLGFVALLYPIKPAVYQLNLDVYTSPSMAKKSLGIGQGLIEGEGTPSIINSNSRFSTLNMSAAENSPKSPLLTNTGAFIALVFGFALLTSKAMDRT